MRIVLQGVVRHQSRPVAEQVLDRDPVLAVVVQLGKELDHAVLQPQLPLLDQEHDGRCRDDGLGQRGHVEDRVASHRLGRRVDGSTTRDVHVGDRSPPSHDHHGARDRSLRRWPGRRPRRSASAEPRQSPSGRWGLGNRRCLAAQSPTSMPAHEGRRKVRGLWAACCLGFVRGIS